MDHGGRSLGERLYGALLRLLPADFRDRHAAEMKRVFREMRDEAARRGRGALLGHYARAGWDVVRMAARRRTSRGDEEGWKMDEFADDLKYTVRQLTRRPGFTGVLVLTLALGVGASTAVFSVVDGVLLRPLPYPDAEELVAVWTQFPSMDLMEFPASAPEFWEFQEQNETFEAVGGMNVGERTLTGVDSPLRLQVAFFTGEVFELLGVEPIEGRSFGEEEDRPEAEPVVVLSEDLWRSRFGADPSVVGRTIRLDGTTTTVLGVMPADFAIPSAEVEAWLPMGLDRTDPPGRASHFMSIVGRLRPGVSSEVAQRDLGGLLTRWEADESIGHSWTPDGHPAFVRPLREQIVGDVRTPLLVLLGAVGFVLLIACTNVANLLLVRGEGRQREISIRTALGAGRGRILRLLVTESLGMALVGGVAGVVLARVGLEVLLGLAPATLPRVDQIGLDLPVLAFSAGITLVSALLFGLAPSLQAARLDVQASLREEGRGGTAGRGRFRFRRLLVVTEMALATVLLVGAGLLMQSFWRLQTVDPGFESEDVLRLSVNLPPATYPEATDVTGFYDLLLTRLRSLPAVTGASAVRTPPLSGSLPPNDISIEGRERLPDDPPMNADIQVVDQGYFRTMNIPLVRGRTFDDTDRADGEVVAVVDRILADRFFAGESPIGRRIRQPGSEWARIVGVVGSVHQEGLDVEPRAHLYFLHEQSPRTWFPVRAMTLLLRTGAEDPLDLVSAVRHEVAQLDPNLPVYEVGTMARTLAESTATERFSMTLQIVFAGVALILAVVGVYGVLSYWVAQRTREIGVRMALGAEDGDITRLVVGQGMALVAVALVLGVLGALAAGEVLRGLLFGIEPNDPATFAGVSAVLAAVAFLACWIPARRASSVSPQTALRRE